MNTNTATVLSALVFGLTLSVTATAESFQHGSGYVNAVSNSYSSADLQATSYNDVSTAKVVDVGFNDRSAVENEGSTANKGSDGKVQYIGMQIVTGQFNDRS